MGKQWTVIHFIWGGSKTTTDADCSHEIKRHLLLGRKVMANLDPLQYSCLENSMDGGAWWAAVHGVAKSWTWLSDFIFIFHFPALEREMATHSSVLAWRIPGTGEPYGLPSLGSYRVGHDWSDLAAAAAVHKGSLFSISSSALVIHSVFDNSHSDRYEVIFHCGFDFHSPDN